jgi:hypothetical protein
VIDEQASGSTFASLGNSSKLETSVGEMLEGVGIVIRKVHISIDLAYILIEMLTNIREFLAVHSHHSKLVDLYGA